MPRHIHDFPNLDDGPRQCIDPAELDCVRTRRLAAKLSRTVRPTLVLQPPRRENLYIALDALAWAVAMILSGTEDRDALDFFALALKQNLARMEEREATANVDPSPSGQQGAVPPKSSPSRIRIFTPPRRPAK